MKDIIDKTKQNNLNEINILKEECNKYKKECDKLKSENNKLNSEIYKLNKIITGMNNNNQIDNNTLKNLKDENNNLKIQLMSKENEIINLKNQMNQINNNIKDKPKYNLDEVLVVYFKPKDGSFYEGIKCLATDRFFEIEERLYQKYEELRNTNNTFTANATPILRFKRLNENKIKDGDVIQLFKLE